MHSGIRPNNVEPSSKVDREARDRINPIVGGNGTCETFRTPSDKGAEREGSSS